MKNFKRLSLVALTMLLVGCGQATSSTSSTSTSAISSGNSGSEVISTSTVDYPEITMLVRGESTVEIGQSITIKSVCSAASGVDLSCTFVSSDTSILTVTVNENKKSCEATGVKTGTAVITVTSIANPNVSKTFEVTVIAEKPSLRQCIKNIQSQDSNYMMTVGKYDSGAMGTPSAITFVMEDAIVSTDYDGQSYFLNDDNDYVYGEKVTANGDVVYLTVEANEIVEENAQIVQCNAGLLNKDNFKGLKDNASQAFEVGSFYSLDAINPEWCTDTKAEDNTYVIEGHYFNDENKLTQEAINSCYLECLLWNLLNASSYKTAVLSAQDDYYFTLAGEVTTTITVTGNASLEIQSVIGSNTYELTMSEINTTTYETIAEYADDLGETIENGNFTASTPTEGSKLEAGITALKTNNYVQHNQVFPDHKTELNYNTYYTEDYVYVACDADFVKEYNRLGIGISDHEDWTDEPNGYVKKSDGIYKFTYDADSDTVVLGDKEANTDANTKLAEYRNYLSVNDLVNTDLKYSLETEEDSIWNGKSTKYYSTDSVKAFYAVMNYYAPEDLEDENDDPTIVEKCHSGIGVQMSAGKVISVDLTAGYTPYVTEDWDESDHTYGVNYFSVKDFGQVSELNPIDAKIRALL